MPSTPFFHHHNTVRHKMRCEDRVCVRVSAKNKTWQTKPFGMEGRGGRGGREGESPNLKAKEYSSRPFLDFSEIGLPKKASFDSPHPPFSTTTTTTSPLSNIDINGARQTGTDTHTHPSGGGREGGWSQGFCCYRSAGGRGWGRVQEMATSGETICPGSVLPLTSEA
eukprot:TRINITY_DN22627_c0_g1_i1.p1 TRINITY_DN22627_c0_g1~~TRINITY_DN22627_c0_g1_i1.p1  ORF type:complete len:167 (+),score=1.27 TRINITY_DN22627_c0_g1_i1:685-1185(+)